MSRGAKGSVFSVFLLCLFWTQGFLRTAYAQQEVREQVCPKHSLAYTLLKDYGSFQCLKVGEKLEQNFDFALPQEKAGEDFQGVHSNGTYDQFIVLFEEYRFGGEHKQSLRNQISVSRGDNRAWKWVERRNEADKYTTDFGVVRVLKGDKQEDLVSLIRGLRSVKQVFLDDVIHNQRTLQLFDDMGPAVAEKDYLDIGRKYEEFQINSLYQPEILWGKGFTGQGIRVGIFDTGMKSTQKHLRNVKWRSNWTYQPSRADGHGHGTSVAGSIASVHPDCPGTAPDVDLYTFKVFTDDGDSFTSWYLDAINFVHVLKLHMINVSIGGLDFKDIPFVDKFRQLVANGVIVFAALGNLGPEWGNLNSPADDFHVLGVGSHNYNFGVSAYQSRGMTLQEKPYGYGRVKPDILTYADKIFTLSHGENGKCTKFHGTSAASPVTLGLSALLASSIPEDERYRKLSPASIKQILWEGADRLKYWSMYEQGPGALNLQKSFDVLREYEPRVTVMPPYIDLSNEADKDYFWPHSAQPLYAHSMPLMVNFTITNGMGSIGYITDAPRWNPSNALGNKLRIQFDYAPTLWPYSGYLGTYMHVEDSAESSSGVAEGRITFQVTSPPFPGETEKRVQQVAVPIKVKVIPTPPRSKRVLWDDYHNLQYPHALVPMDGSRESHNHDFAGDHPHTNYKEIFTELVDNGYYVEILSSSLTCFDAMQYGMLIILDPEVEFDQEEIDKLYRDVAQDGLGLVVLADWYSKDRLGMQRSLFSENIRAFLEYEMGGCNVPALNRLLSNFNIAFSNITVEGEVTLGETGKKLPVFTGTSIAKLPPKSVILETDKGKLPVLALTKVEEGNIIVFTDSSSFDLAVYYLKKGVNRWRGEMNGVFTDFTKYASEGETPAWIEAGTFHEDGFQYQFAKRGGSYSNYNPEMIPDEFENLSPEKMKIFSKPVQCFRNAPLEYQPDRTEMVRKRNNVILSWMSWAKDRINSASSRIDGSEKRKASGGLPNENSSSTTTDIGGEESIKPTEQTHSNYPVAQVFGLFFVVFCLMGVIYLTRGKLNRKVQGKSSYSRAKQSV